MKKLLFIIACFTIVVFNSCEKQSKNADGNLKTDDTYQKEFMLEAIKLSKECLETGQGGPFGAVIVKDGKIVGRGSNQVTINNDPTAHAEVVAIRDACKNLNTFQLDGCEIYTSCEPCVMSLCAIYWAHLSKIYYAGGEKDASDAGFDNSFINNEIALPKAERKIPAMQCDQEEAVKVLEAWKKLSTKVEY